MARPFKSGVDYFPLDVKMDDEIELLESEHGITGFGVLIKLYQRIYANNYWYKWDKKAVIVFSNRVNVDKNSVNDVINTCLEWDIFNKKLFNKYQILTSKGIQKRYFEITDKRKRVEVIKEFTLIKIERENIINVDINSINDGNSTQSKVKGKGKEINNTYNPLSNIDDFIKNIPETIYKKYPGIDYKLVADDIVDYCQSKGKKYKDYYAAMRNFIKNDDKGRYAKKQRPTSTLY